jgi:hypothetical protein
MTGASRERSLARYIACLSGGREVSSTRLEVLTWDEKWGTKMDRA